MKRPTNWYLAGVVFMFALFVRLFHWFRAGLGHPRLPPDTQYYLGHCQGLLGTFPEIIIEKIHIIGFLTPLCAVINLTDGSIQTWLLIQVALSAVTCVLIYDAGQRLIDWRVGLVAGLSLGVFYDTFRWQIAPLSDTLFVFVIGLCLWAVTRHYVAPTRRTRLVTLGCLLWLVTVRPHGLPLAVGWIFYDLFPTESEHRLELVPWRKVALSLTVGGIAIGLYLLSQMSVESAGPLTAVREGWIFWREHNRTPLTYTYAPRQASNMLVFLLVNADHVLIMGVMKIVAFFYPIVNWGYSGPLWKLYHQLTLAPVLVGSLLGLAKMIRDRSPALKVWVTPLAMLLLVISITFIDYFTFRYRAPAGPVFALLTGYAIGTSTAYRWIEATVANLIRSRWDAFPAGDP